MKKEMVKLHDIFDHLQTQMIEALNTNKEIISHPPTQGDATELCWLKMLNEYLPKRYKAEKAFVLDSEGSLSQQIDIVIFDQQYSPFLFNQNGTIYIPAESVYAVFEVRPSIGKRNIEYAGEKAASVRKLKRTNAPIYHAGGVVMDPKKPFQILSGLLTLDSGWKSFNEQNILKFICSLPPEKRLDIGCVLNEGAFNILCHENDPAEVIISNNKNALISFFLQLLSRLQRLGTVPAIEIDRYAESLG